MKKSTQAQGVFRNRRRGLVLAALLAAVTLSLTGCGKPAFRVIASVEDQKAPGNFMVPAKVDILFAEDDTGSIFEAYPTIKNQLPAFLTNLQAKGWDYHFATIPLTKFRAISEIMASQYDSNWGAQWTPPYPGAKQGIAGTVNASYFRKPPTDPSSCRSGEYCDFLASSDINNNLNGSEPGFENIRQALVSIKSDVTSGFLRNDALLVVVVMGNGNDTSGVTFCTRSDGYVAPCELIGFPGQGTMQSSFDYYKAAFLGIKPTGLIKFHAAVANTSTNNCLGGKSYVGTRYQQMASALNGSSEDLCSLPISSVLDSLASDLHATKIAFRTRYLFIAQDPDPTTIVVTRYLNGDASQASTIPHDADNGWTYAGSVSNVFTIDSPILMNQASGFAIELHGTAKLIGDDTASVTFTPAVAK